MKVERKSAWLLHFAAALPTGCQDEQLGYFDVKQVA
jgi:hypothetical protein